MLRGLRVSSGGVRGVWIRNRLKTRHERLLRLEETVRKRKIKLTEEQMQALERFDPEFCERQRPLLGPGDRGARSRVEAGSTHLREAFRQATEERHLGRGGDHRSGAASDHALCGGEVRSAAGSGDALSYP